MYDLHVWPRLSEKNPCPGIMILRILVDHSLVIITTYIIYLIHAPVWKRTEEIVHFTIEPRPSTRTPAPGVMQFTILVCPSVIIITILSVCLIYDLVHRRNPRLITLMERGTKRNQPWVPTMDLVLKKVLIKSNAFSLYYFYGHALAQGPLPWGS